MHNTFIVVPIVFLPLVHKIEQSNHVNTSQFAGSRTSSLTVYNHMGKVQKRDVERVGAQKGKISNRKPKGCDCDNERKAIAEEKIGEKFRKLC